jgi:hypothetical protein
MDKLSEEDIAVFELMGLVNRKVTIGSMIENIEIITIKAHNLVMPIGSTFELFHHLKAYDAFQLLYISPEGKKICFATQCKYFDKKFKKVITMLDIKKQ